MKQNLNLGLLVLRLFIGARLVYGSIDNILLWERTLEFSQFLQEFGFPLPLYSAMLSAYVQFFGGLMIALGFKVRPVAIVLMFNFLIALVFVHFQIPDSVEEMTPALAMFFGNMTLFFTGPGLWSIDPRFQRSRKS